MFVHAGEEFGSWLLGTTGWVDLQRGGGGANYIQIHDNTIIIYLSGSLRGH